MSKPSVVVVGGGASGLCAALQLTRLGAEVTVLERGALASGSSGLSVGIIETQYVNPLDIELRVRGMEFFDVLERDHQLNVTHNGYLRLAHTTAELDTFANSVSVQRGLGVRETQVLTPKEINTIVPDMRTDDLTGGLFGARDGYIDGHLYCNLLAGLAKDGGARVLTETALLRETRGSQRAHRLTTTAGDLECDVVVNAAGAWAGEVGTLLGATAVILPQRHQIALAHFSEPLPYMMPSVMDYVPHTGDYGLYLRHDGPARLIVGLHSEEVLHDVVDPNRYNRSPDYAFLETVAPQFLSRLPGLARAQLRPGWAGLYPVSPDGLPQIGPSRERETVILACGVGGSGIQISPAVGQLAAEWVLYGEPRSLRGAMNFVPSRASLAKGGSAS